MYGLTEKKQKKNKCLAKTNSEYKFKNYKFNSEMKNIYNGLITDNFGSKAKFNLFETHFKNPSKKDVFYIGKNDNIDGYNMTFGFLKTDIENYNQNNVDGYIMMKDNEINKWEEKERKRREKERQQINALLNNYEQI